MGLSDDWMNKMIGNYIKRLVISDRVVTLAVFLSFFS